MQEARVLLGVTGGIAAYKACELVRLLVKGGAAVRVFMTAHACRFVTPLTFEVLTGRPVGVDLFAPRGDAAVGHVEAAAWCDLFCVAPATANVIGKLASGIADDLLTTTALALPGDTPRVLAPAMNERMWKHPAVAANCEMLRSRGAILVGPKEGHLACGDEGAGRMAEPEEILAAIARALEPKA